jgi:cell division protein FtsI/penicillin-binding protein 2
LEVSCNRYFAYLFRDSPGWPVYRREVAALVDRLGLGHPTGVDVAAESPGRWLQDWVDFVPRAPFDEAASRVRAHRAADGVAIRVETHGALPPRLAGRDPQRLVTTLEALLAWGVDAARPAPHEAVAPGGVVLRAGFAGAQDRWVDLRVDVLVTPGPDGADPRRPAPVPPSLVARVASIGGDLTPYAPGPGVRALTFTVTYHRPIGRAPGEPPVVLHDDGRNVAIGQGPVLVTPLQMARAMAALANGGRLVTPHVATHAGGTPLVPHTTDLGIDPAVLEPVRAGMRRVVIGPEGTARRATWSTVPAAVYGKTGTAQTGGWWRPDPTREAWHHWFVGWAEAPGMPTIAFACVLHARGESGASATAVHATRDFLAWWFTEGPDAGLR